MRSLPIFLLFSFFGVLIHSRPSQTDENNERYMLANPHARRGKYGQIPPYDIDLWRPMFSSEHPMADMMMMHSDIEEAEYIEEDKAIADTPNGESSVDENLGREIDQSSRILDMNKNTNLYKQKHLAESRAGRSHSDISEYTPYGDQDVRNGKTEETNNYDDSLNYAKRRQSKFIENKETADQQEATRNVHDNVNYYKNSRVNKNLLLENPSIKREASVKADHGEMLFESQDQANQADRKEIHHEPLEVNQRYAKYYTQIHPENKELIQRKSREGDHIFFNRDRRESKDYSEDTASKISNKELDKNQNEDDEMAIRRHIKKLSNDELEELLSSLSEEKRQLLKTIIDDSDITDSNDNVKKREITKKAGALEENSCIQSGQADSSNIHSDNSAASVQTDIPVQMSATESSKQTQSENTNLVIAKSAETNSSSKAGTINQHDENVQQKTDAETSDVENEKSPAQIVPSEQATVKTEKRETNLDDLADIVSFEDPKTMENDWLTGDSKDQQGYICSQDEDLSQFLDDDQAVANDGSKVYKRDLEKQADYDAKYKSLQESFPKPNAYDETAGPLIRVKRKNEPAIKKRSAAIVPDAKVAYFPYRAETDEDNEEGNEFDDDGFYDRTPNFSSNEVNKPAIIDAANCKLNSASANDISKDTMSLGSDTDSVLSGVEGVDETLMLSSGSRNRRTSEDMSDVMEQSNSIHNSKSLSDETKAVSDMNALTYQESDSFGPLPRNNEGESGRYKRIRRVKQSHPERISSES